MSSALYVGRIRMHPMPRRRSKDRNPPGEKQLRDLGGAYEEAEAEIRGLVADSVGGNAADLRSQAKEALDALAALQAGEAIHAAYLIAYDKAAGHVEKKSVTEGPDALAAGLESNLGQARDESKGRLDGAFEDVDEENLPDKQAEAVTAHVDDAGRAWPLGAWASLQIKTLGRRATSRGTIDGVGTGKVRFSSHGTTHPTCAPLEGEVFPAATAPEPPMHEGCGHTLEPV